VVRTVLGPVPIDQVGPTLIHEHLLIRNPSFVEPTDPRDRLRAHQPVTLENLGWVRRHWTSNEDNLVLDDADLAIRELAAFVSAGGRTVVDATVPGIGRDPDALVRIAQEAGINVVMGAGAYIGSTHPPAITHLDEDGVVELLLREWRQGVGDAGIRPGFLGEIGCSWPLDDRERKVLRAAGHVQAATGAALMVHPGRDARAPGEIVRILEEVKADLGRVAIAHLDRTVTDVPGLVELAAAGVTLEFDCFGLEGSYYPFDARKATLSDAQRLDLVRGVFDAGLGDRVVLAHDICTKHRLSAYGGHGYGHLLAEVVPWMHERGFTGGETTAMLIDNPARLLGVPASQEDH
jgi:phosphotriesterase-related protein